MTYPTTEEPGTLAAASMTARLLAEAGRHADLDLHSPMEDFVGRRLGELGGDDRTGDTA